MNDYKKKLVLIGAAVGLGIVGWVNNASAQTPSCVGYSGLVNTSCELYARADDPENDPIYYIYSWGDGSVDTRVPASGTVASGTEVAASHTWASAGTFTIRVYAYDEAGHQSTASDPVVVIITADSTGPTLDYTPNGSGGWQASATSITLSVTDPQGVSSARYNWDAAASETVGTVYTNNTVISSPAGSHTLYLWAKDNLNNSSTKGPSLAYQYDNTNPTAPGQPTCTPNPNNTGAHSCTWTASTDTQSGLAGYLVYQSLNGGAFQVASPPSTATNSWSPAPALASGTYQYQVYAYDNVGRLSAVSPVSANVVVDKTAPNAPTCNPGTGTYSSAQSVSCSATDAGSPATTVTVRYTSAPTLPSDPTCASPAFTNPTSISTTTTLKVIACDAAANFSAVTTYTYQFDSTGPTLDYTPNGSGGWQASATSITLSVTDPQGVAQARYNWDAAASETVGTVYTNNTVISSPAGSHTLYLWAKDTLNNSSTKGPSLAYQYDNTNPTIPGQPACSPNPNNTGAHSCTWTASTDTQSGLAGYLVYQSLNGGAFQVASPPSTATNSWSPAPALASGTYQYQVYAYDNVGRLSAVSPVSANVVVDKTAPNAPTCNPGTGTYSSAQSVSCSATDAGSPATTVTVRYTSAPTLPSDPTCASPAFTNPTSISTTTTLKVMACDGAGNNSAVVTYTYTFDSTGPTLDYTPNGSGGWQAIATAITLTVSDPQGVAQARYNWDAAASETVGTVYTNNTVISSPAGSHVLYLWAKDTLNNSSTKGPSLAYQYDNTNPTIPGQPACSPNPNNTGAHSCTWTASTDTQSGLAGYLVYQSLNGGAFQVASPPSTATNSWSPAPALASGTYQYQVYAYDNVGRLSAVSPVSANVVVDKTAPNAPTCNPGTGTYSSAQSVSCSATDAGSPTTTVTVRYTSAPTPPSDPTCASPAFTNPTNISTTTTLKVIACDGAGNNSGVTTYNYTIIINPPPQIPYNPAPADGGYVSVTPVFSWYGGDSDSVTYKVFISPDATINDPADYDGSITVIGGSQFISYGPPQSKVLTPGTEYWWQVWADDTPTGQPTYPERPIRSPIRSFTVNNVPQTTSGGINPTTVNKQATVSWQASDNNNDQALTFDLYYNTSPNSLVGATKVNSLPLTTSGNCSGVANSSGWNCSYVWDTSCVPAATNLYLVVVVSDGYDAVVGGDSSTFAIDHTDIKQFPTSGFGTANDNEVINMTIDQGSIDNSILPPQVIFQGMCGNPKTKNPSVQANAAAEAKYSGSLDNGEFSPAVPLSGLLPAADNTLTFKVGGCRKTGYQITYNLVTSCNRPYLATQNGDIYSSGNVRAEHSPPSGSFNSQYLILGGGTNTQLKVIENFIAPQVDYIRPNFGAVPYPTISTSDRPQDGTFDYYSLIHKANGSLVANGDTDIYGYTVKVWGSLGQTTAASDSLNQGGNDRLNRRVYYFKGNLDIDEPITFKNGSGSQGGAGLIIVDGNLTFNADSSYEAGPYQGSISNIASVGWLVRGSVTVASSVARTVGAIYVAGDQSGGGMFDTGSGSGQLNIYGPLIAKKINWQRTYSANNEPAEKVIMDGRIIVNTPPGFANLLRTLPAWLFNIP
ncbi:MAG: chitobiase/beta-hexosaminidase C-terminal domain-containing protein [Patescibacteria group bacterium]